MEQSRPPHRNTRRDLVGMNAEKGDYGHDAQLLVMDPGKGLHAPKPKAEEFVRPAIRLKDLQ